MNNLHLLSKNKIIGKYLELEKENEALKKKNEFLEKEIRKYKNSNTPSSAHPHLKSNTSGLKAKKGAKRGAPKGHRGITRLWKETRDKVIIKDKQCPNCQSHNIKDKNIKTGQQEEIPPDIEPEIVDVDRYEHECNECGFKWIARDNKTPLKGRLGINLMVLVIFLKFIVRGVLRKTAGFLEASFALKLAPASINAILTRAAEATTKEYEQIKERIRKSIMVYIDETSFSVNGKKWWVWVFRSETDILYVIRKSRGSNVLKEILGENYAGTVICDCWRAYDFLIFANIQRCWAHLLRKSKELCTSVAGRHFHEKLKKLFEQIEPFNLKERTEKQRARKYKQMTAKLKSIIDYYSKYEDCQSVVKYIDNHLKSWFTCIKIAGIQPTNNFAEQPIREPVMVRKIIGAFRSEKGTQTYETLASLIATWQFNKLDLKQELRRVLTAHLC